MSRALLAVHLAVALCYLPGAVSAQEDAPELQERFVQGVKQSWEKLQHVSFRARCEYSSTESASDKRATRTYEMGIRGPNGLETGVRSDAIRFVQARNDAYAFMLNRSLDGTGSSLQFLEPVGVDPVIDAKIAAIEKTPRAIALAAYYLWNEPLARVIELDSFVIKRVYPVPSEDHELVRVEFDYEKEDPSSKRHERNTDGYLVCDPESEWILKEYGATFLSLGDNATGVRKVVQENGDAIGEMPIATKITVAYARHDKDYTSENVMNVIITGRELPEEELYLSHYGLPEPNFERSWFGAWGWYLIGGIGCVVVGAIMITWRNTRR